MSSAHYGLSCENLMRSLPQILQSDPKTRALAASIAHALSARLAEIDQLKIYTRILDLPEDLLDILARDLKVDWWNGDYSLEEKRDILLDSWNVHRTLGTKGAVETALSAIYPNTQVREWFEYGGSPYHFKLLIDATYENVDPGRHQRMLDRVAFYKNLRSVLDEIEYYDAGGISTAYATAAYVGCEIVDGAIAQRY